MSFLKDLKAIAQFADSVVSGGETLREQFKGKSSKEAMDFLRGNLKALKSPQTFTNLQNSLKNQSPTELAEFLASAHKNLSLDDAIKIAEALTSDNPDQALPKYLEKKIKNPNPVRLPKLGRKGKKNNPKKGR